MANLSKSEGVHTPSKLLSLPAAACRLRASKTLALGLSLLLAAVCLHAQKTIRLPAKPSLMVTNPQGHLHQIVYNHHPLEMKLHLLLPNGEKLSCRWQVTEANSTVKMPDRKGDIAIMTPNFPGEGGVLDIRYFVSFPKDRYEYPVPREEGLPTHDDAGNLLAQNVKWVALNPHGKAFFEIDRISFRCIKAPRER